MGRDVIEGAMMMRAFLLMTAVMVVASLQGTASAAEPSATGPVGHFTPWDVTTGDRLFAQGPILVKCSPDSRWIATLDNDGALRLFSTGDDLTPDRLLYDTEKLPFVVRDIAWIGDRLAYWRVLGPRTYLEYTYVSPVETEYPYGDPRAYEAQHSETALYSPAHDTETVPLDAEGGVTLTDEAAEALVLCASTSTHDTLFSFMGTTVRAFDVSDGDRVTALDPAIGTRMLHGSIAGGLKPHPLLRFDDLAFFWAEGRTTGPSAPYSDREIDHAAMAVVRLDGTWQFLTEGDRNMYYDQPPGLPAAVRREEGQIAIACMLRKWGDAPWRLVYFSHSGQVLTSYDLGLTYGAIRQAANTDETFLPITVTPDGRYLLLQQSGKRDFILGNEKKRLWLWDLAEQEVAPVADLPAVRAVYGWAREDDLLVAVAGDHGGDIVGVLHIPWQSLHN